MIQSKPHFSGSTGERNALEQNEEQQQESLLWPLKHEAAKTRMEEIPLGMKGWAQALSVTTSTHQSHSGMLFNQ